MLSGRMDNLTEDALQALNARHAKFEDCLIRRVTLAFTATPQWRQVTVEIEAKDNRAADGWGQVLFEFRGVTLFHLLEAHTTNVVLGGIEWTPTAPGWKADFSPVHSEGSLSTFIIEAQEVRFRSTPDSEPVQIAP